MEVRRVIKALQFLIDEGSIDGNAIVALEDENGYAYDVDIMKVIKGDVILCAKYEE